mmetsp:Transcript_120/g.144  ORF Transcript_120/g.144 Transcript_120/m.144 type:complete len:296 (+) Transcript_120:142-1029(+)|eukprot:CAMPEP_0198145448 /NCGR_PEP_ID=MMETSP1443-20131203/23554_1 /TAXON_ID=186043 /ORGANISM="Entomoneis sp., Strain CCMP2396" /LENGTH=295 /DNA_ID=CAMNT_0043809103 /DNA_START=56 /DNA_END=943 /DNA_ORIENTATION=-
MVWTVDQFDAHLTQMAWESFVNHYVAAGMMLGVLAIALSYTVVHRVLNAKSKIYRDDLTNDQQLVVVHHSIEAIFLSLFFVPLTYVILSLNFEKQSLEELANKVAALGVMMFVIIIMYMMELASRFQNQRSLVVAHHLCAYLDAIFPAFALSTANIKASSLLVYFITYEAITFVGLVMYRLCPENRATRPIIAAGMIVFGLSRPLQIVWILSSLAVSWEHLVVWHAVLQIIFSVVFTALQLFTLSIHYSLYKKCGDIRLQAESSIKNDSECRDGSRTEEDQKYVMDVEEVVVAEA